MPGYQSQLDPANVATPLAPASAEDFGASIGRALEQGGATIDHAIHTIRERDRDQQATDAAVTLANVSTAIDKAAIDARDHAAPGGEGHSDGVAAAFDQQRDAALARIKDPKIRSAFTARYAELRDHVVTREYGWEAGKRVDKLATDFDNTGTTFANGQASNPDAVGLEVSLNTIQTAGDALTGVDADTKKKLIKQQQNKVAIAYGNAEAIANPDLILGDPAKGYKGILAEPQYTRFLEPDDIERLRSAAGVEQRRREAEARQQRNLEEAQVREGVSLIGKRIAAGDLSVSDQEFDTAEAGAKKYDLKGPEFDLANWRDQRDVNKETRTWNPATWHANIDALEAKGDKRTVAENLRLNHLQEAAPGAIGRFNADPYAAAAVAGNAAPQVDWSNPDPRAIDQRVAWARSFAKSSGLVNVPYLSVDELKVFRDRAAQGPAGQLEVAATMRQAFGAANASGVVRQIDPNSKDLQLMVGLHPRVAELYRKGVAALEAKTVKLGGEGDEGAADQQAMRDIFAEYAGAIPTDMQPAVLNAARNITAGMAAEYRDFNPSGSDLSTAFRGAMQRAGGMTGAFSDGHNSPGGFVNWQGRQTWIPSTMTRDDFQRRLSRAKGEDWMRAGGGAPYVLGGDGKLTKMSESQISHLGQYRLELGTDEQGRSYPGLYRLVSPIDGAHVFNEHHQPFQFDIRNLR
jgi:hypothetical protein